MMLMTSTVTSSRNQGVEKTLKKPSLSNASTSSGPAGRSAQAARTVSSSTA